MEILYYIAVVALIAIMVIMVIVNFIAAGKEDKRDAKRLRNFKEKRPIKKSSQDKADIVFFSAFVTVLWLVFADPLANVNMPINFSFSFILAGLIAFIAYVIHMAITIESYPIKTMRVKLAAKMYLKSDQSTMTFLMVSKEIMTFRNVKRKLFLSAEIGDIVNIEYQGAELRKVQKEKPKPKAGKS